MMKLLIGLLFLVSAAFALNCMTQASTGAAFTSVACDSKVTKCFYPNKNAAKVDKDKVLYGCGTCKARKTALAANAYTNDNDCSECDGEECNAAFKCLKTNGNKVELKGCLKADADKCFKPKDTTFTDGTGYSAEGAAYGFGCGDCTAAQKEAEKVTANANTANKANHCSECTKSGCNKQIEMSTMKCYAYTWNDAEGKKLFEKKDATVCPNLQKASETAKFVCSSPKAGLGDADKTLKFGCVACDPTAKTAGKCMECKTDKCNSASSLIGSVLVLLAAVYMLF